MVQVSALVWISARHLWQTSRKQTKFGMLLPPYNRRCKGGASVWADATQGMASSAATVGQRRADAGRAAAQARKMWHLLRARLRGDVSGALGCCCFVCLLLSRFCLEGDCMLCCLLVSMCMPAGCRGSSQRHQTIFGLGGDHAVPSAAHAVLMCPLC